MSTRLQKKLAAEIAKDAQNERPTGSTKLLEKVGYATTTAWHKQKTILEAVGVTDELIKLGFTVDKADEVVASVLQNAKKDSDRLGAADRIYKRFGANAPEKQAVFITETVSPAVVELAQKLLKAQDEN